MRIKAQTTMVLNLDKCLGCHTCSIPCKNVWTNREGAEYMWFNNVETKPGIGYPKKWENQEVYRGGWEVKNGKTRLKAGGRAYKLLRIFHNPDMPTIDQYYEPWTYDYRKLTDSPPRRHQPSLRPRSLISGDDMDVNWGPNWEDDLAGVSETGSGDVNFAGIDHEDYLRFERTFMFYVPRLCEHCLHPGCVASCPSGALYKRDEDGIVLVDQTRCRGWRYCVTGCPYKKVYMNWKRGVSEKCIFCYPRVENGLPTLCAQTCVGRLRYIGVILYDADRIAEASSVEKAKAIYPAHLDIMLNPEDENVLEAAREQGIPESFLSAARRSPVYKLMKKWRLALPLHPEFGTLPMVWYVPPLSPVDPYGKREETKEGPLEPMRIPLRYLANLLTAGDESPVRAALAKLTAVRKYMRSVRVGPEKDADVLRKAGLDEETAHEMYNLLAIAKYKDRFVIPSGNNSRPEILYNRQGSMGLL